MFSVLHLVQTTSANSCESSESEQSLTPLLLANSEEDTVIHLLKCSSKLPSIAYYMTLVIIISVLASHFPKTYLIAGQFLAFGKFQIGPMLIVGILNCTEYGDG